jgi:hypothetical protein
MTAGTRPAVAGTASTSRRFDPADVLAVSIIAAVLIVPAVGLMRYQGPPMEEGFMLAFPEQILQGRLPHRDFLHLYGPGSLWVLAAVYWLFEPSLVVERLVGLAQHAGVAFGLYALVRPFGRPLATGSAVVSVLLLIGPGGLSAMAWNGALALGLCALALGTAAARRPDGRVGNRMLVGAGVLGGAALLYRPDMIVAVALGLGAVALSLSPRRRLPLGAGLAATLALYIPHVLMSGVGNSVQGMFIEPVLELRGGRTLPVPPSWGEIDGFLQRAGALRRTGWPFPMPELSQQIHLWFWLVPISIIVTLLAAWRLRQREPGSDRARALWPGALFGAALIPQALQRPDTTHLAWVTGVTFALMIPSVASLIEFRWPSSRPSVRVLAAHGLVAVILVGIIPFYPARTYVDLVGQSFGRNRFGEPIRNDGRVFYFGDAEVARQAQEVVDRLAEESRPGEMLIVGPTDLSRTNYNDAFFYHLFPELVPGTRYIEMDPGIANAADSGLADELRQNDWLILSRSAAQWVEPNESRFAGSTEPNEVVDELYCPVVDAGGFQLLRRCRDPV